MKQRDSYAGGVGQIALLGFGEIRVEAAASEIFCLFDSGEA